MEQSTLERKIRMTEAWLDNNDAGSNETVMRLLIENCRNAETDDERKNQWVALHSVGKTFGKQWWVRQGRGPSISDDQQMNLDTVENELRNAYTEMAENHPIILATQRRHGRMKVRGGQLYLDVEDFAETQASSGKADLLKQLKDGNWDGNLPVVLNIPVKSDGGDTEEE